MSGPTNDHDLTNALRQRADDFARLGGHDLDLTQVVSRAGEIRRGRRMRASMVMAAVAIGVAVPVGITVLDNDPTRTNPDLPIATNSVSPSPSPTPSPTKIDPSPDPVGLDGLAQGAESRLPYVAGKELHFLSTTLPLGDGEVGAVARIVGGYLVGQYDDQGETARFLDDDGNTVNSWAMADGSNFAVSEDGSIGAFAQPDRTVIAVQDSGSRWFEVGKPLPAGGSYQVEAVQGETCTDRSETPGCTIWVLDASEKTQVWAVAPNQAPTKTLAGWLRLNDVTAAAGNPLFAGMVSVSNDGSCSEVTEMHGPDVERLWKTCENSLDSFSPTARYVVAGPAYRDGPGDGIIAVLDARTGKTLSTIKADDQSVFSQYVWEDDSHLLAVVQDLGGPERAGLVRIGLDGSRELVAPAVTLDGGLGYRLPTG